MAAKRIMLLGAGGQVGQALVHQQMPNDWEFRAYGHAECDITKHRVVQDEIRTFKPDLIINSAAMTAVDKCETEIDQAMAANFEGPTNLASQCSVLDIPLIHISTDYVFDGTEGETPYKPDHQMNPPNIYGSSKMMGEEGVRNELAWHVILRISSVFSEFGNNLLTRMLQSIDTRDELKAVTDQKSCPTPAQDIAKALLTISTALLHGKGNGFGTFHYCGEGAATRLEFVEAIMKAYAPYTEKRPKILPALTGDFPGFAPRPPYSVLDCTKIRDVYGVQQKPWREGLTAAMQVLMRDRRKVA